MRRLVIAALVASACRFDADYGGTSYRCDDQPICPAGFTCMGGVCRSQPLDGGPGDAGETSPLFGDVVTYTFDDYAVTDVAHDRSGHRHDGSDRSLTLGAGRYGQGLSLNGSPLDIPDTGDFFSPGRLTIEMWLFRNRGGERQALLSDFDAAEEKPDTEISLEIAPDDRLELLIAPDCDTDGVVTAASERTVPVTTWTHVAAVWDEGEARFYLDGEEAGSAPLAGGCQRTARFAIGSRNNGNYSFTGAIDEVKVSSSVRTPEEIRASMSYDSAAAPPVCGDLLIEDEPCDGPGMCCGGCQTGGDTACGVQGTCSAGACLLPAGARVDSDLIALYRFDDASGATIADGSGNGLHLTIGNPAAVTWGAGTLTVGGAAAIASGNAGGKLSACGSAGEVTVEAWVEAEADTREGRLVGVIQPGAINLSLSQGKLAWMAGVQTDRSIANGHPVVDTPPGDVTNRLSHLVMARSSDGWRRLYVDGALRGSNLVEGALAWDQADEVITLASDADGSDAWRGTYHLVAIYCRALDELEVAQNLAAGAD